MPASAKPLPRKILDARLAVEPEIENVVRRRHQSAISQYQ